MCGNVFRILGIQSREDAVSNLLAALVNESPDFGCAFVKAIGCGVTSKQTEIVAHTRVYVSGVGTPDLMLKVKHDGTVRLIVIECKLRAGEGEGQLERYASLIDSEGPLKPGQTNRYVSQKAKDSLKKQTASMEPDGAVDDRLQVVYLTLSPPETPKNKEFLHKTLKDVVPAIQTCARMLEGRLGLLAGDLAEVLRDYYQATNVTPETNAAKALQAFPELDANYDNYVELCKWVEGKAGIPANRFLKQSRPGRKAYIAVFRREEWEFVYQKKKKSEVHIELQIASLANKNEVSVLLHHETSPYETKGAVKEDNWMEQLKDQKRKLASCLRSAKISGVLDDEKIDKGWLLIAKTGPVCFSKTETLDTLACKLAAQIKEWGVDEPIAEYCAYLKKQQISEH